MATILVHLASNSGRVRRSSLEVLSRCRELADRDGHTISAVLADPYAHKQVEAAKSFGADKIFVATDPMWSSHSNEQLCGLLAYVARKLRPSLIAFAGTESAKDILGALAVDLGAAVLPDVAAFDLTSGRVDAVRPVMAAKRLARVHAEDDCVIVSVRSGSYGATENPGSGDVIDLDGEYTAVPDRLQIVDVVETPAGAVDLSEAAVVVSAGRGIKDEKGTELVAELANLLGGAIGATRAVVENGLYPATAQIGQTGKVVAPELYFALGISGAIQHVAGMANSRVIVAINKDSEAPIFEYATYGIVGDLERVLPELVDKVRASRTT